MGVGVAVGMGFDRDDKRRPKGSAAAPRLLRTLYLPVLLKTLLSERPILLFNTCLTTFLVLRSSSRLFLSCFEPAGNLDAPHVWSAFWLQGHVGQILRLIKRCQPGRTDGSSDEVT